jgi:hypothetical protein
VRLEDVTHLGRPVDLGYPTNRAIAVVTAACAVGLTALAAVRGEVFGDAARIGAWGALSVFLAWALAREVDPLGERPAFIGAALALGWVVWRPHDIDLAGLFWALMTLRLVAATTGRPATVLDTVTLLGLTAWVAFGGFAFVAPVAAVAFGLDGWLGPRPVRRHRAAAVVALGITIAALWRDGGVQAEWPGGWTAWAVLAAVVLFVARVMPADPRRVGDDAHGTPLDPRRVRAAQGLAIAVVVQAWAADALPAFIPLAAALGGAALGPRR